MDERLESLLENLKATAGQVGDVAANTASTVTNGAAAVVNHAQTKLKLVDLKAEVNLQLRELGELLYATHTGTPTDSDVLLEKMQQIDALKAQIAELNATASPEKEAPAYMCPICGAKPESADDVYCKHCGSKL